jgi:hypothetical protein
MLLQYFFMYFLFSFAHIAIPLNHTVRELIGDVLIACNIVRTFYYNPYLLTDGRNMIVQREMRHSSLDMHMLLELAWYMASFPYLKDNLMVIHHVLTVVIVVVGYVMNVTYFSFLLFSLIIWSNIFFGAAKIAYSRAHWLQRPMAMCFALSFFLFRTVLFPFWLLPMLFVDARDYWVHERRAAPMYYSSCIVLSTIALMQYFWLFKIVRFIMRTF